MAKKKKTAAAPAKKKKVTPAEETVTVTPVPTTGLRDVKKNPIPVV